MWGLSEALEVFQSFLRLPWQLGTQCSIKAAIAVKQQSLQ